MPKISVIISLLAIYVIWGSTFAAIKIGVEHYPPFLLAALRFTLSGLIFFAIALYRDMRKVQLRQMARSALIGIILTFSNAIVCWAEMGLDSGLSALIITSVPIFLVTLNTFSFERIPPTRLSIAGLIISIIGLVIIFYPAIFTSSIQKQLPFMLLLVGSSLAWAIGSLLQKTTRDENPIPFFQNLAIQIFFGGIVLFVISFLSGERLPVAESIMLVPTLSIIYLSLIGTVVAYTCYIHCLRNAPAALVSTYALVNPVIAILLGVIFLNEMFNVRLAYASSLVLLGVGLIIFEPYIRSKAKKITLFNKQKKQKAS